MEQPSTTVDHAELLHFQKFSTLWWTGNSEMKSLLAMNKLRVPLITEGLISTGKLERSAEDNPRPLDTVKILDAGCGAGYLTEALGKLGAKATGIDPCKELCECAAEHAKLDSEVATNVTYLAESIEDHSKQNVDKYDAVVASEVLEHVTAPRLFLESCVKTIKPGGSIFITTENRTFYSWLAGIIMAEYVLGVLPKGTHDWNKFIPPNDVKQILEENNCEVRSTSGMFYNFYTNKWYWWPSTWLNYALHAVKKE